MGQEGDRREAGGWEVSDDGGARERRNTCLQTHKSCLILACTCMPWKQF